MTFSHSVVQVELVKLEMFYTSLLIEACLCFCASLCQWTLQNASVLLKKTAKVIIICQYLVTDSPLFAKFAAFLGISY